MEQIQELLVLKCTGLIHAKWLPKDVPSTSLPGNIQGGHRWFCEKCVHSTYQCTPPSLLYAVEHPPWPLCQPGPLGHADQGNQEHIIPDHSYTQVANWVPTCKLATLPLPEKKATDIDWAKFNDTEKWPFHGSGTLAGMIKDIELRGLVVDGCPVCETVSDVGEGDYTCECEQKVQAIPIFKPQIMLHGTDMCHTQVAGMGANAFSEKLLGMQAGKFRLFYRATPHQVEAMLQSIIDNKVFFDFYVRNNPNKSGKEGNKFYLTN